MSDIELAEAVFGEDKVWHHKAVILINSKVGGLTGYIPLRFNCNPEHKLKLIKWLFSQIIDHPKDIHTESIQEACEAVGEYIIADNTQALVKLGKELL